MHRLSIGRFYCLAVWTGSFLLLAVSGNADQCAVVHWVPIKGRKLVTRPICSQTVDDLRQCLVQCFTIKNCVSLNFGPPVGKDNVCELLRTDRHTLHSNFTEIADWTHVGRESKCDTSPCPLNKSCIPDYNKNTRICIDNKDCQSILNNGGNTSGVYHTVLNGLNSSVYCDQKTDGGGWLVIQRNKLNFNFLRSWKEYKDGFGDLQSSFWWGNEKIHQLTWPSGYDLRVDLKRTNGADGYAKYSGFKLSDEVDGYRLSLIKSSYTGNIGDAMHHSRGGYQSVGKKFTTKDRTHDTCGSCNINCATNRKSGWWYGWCSYADLNGPRISWMTSSGPFTQSELKIRPSIH